MSPASESLHSHHHHSGARSAQGIWAAWDGAGALASFVCLIHCVGVPLLIAAFPGVTFGFFEAESFHRVVAFIAAILAFSAFTRGFRQHGKSGILVIGLIGCVLLFVAAWLPESMLSRRGETEMTLVGTFFLIGAHLWNFLLMDRVIHARCDHGVARASSAASSAG